MTDKLVISAMIKYIKSQKDIWSHFNHNFVTQKYELRFMLENIFYILDTGLPWRLLARHNNNRNIYINMLLIGAPFIRHTANS